LIRAFVDISSVNPVALIKFTCAKFRLLNIDTSKVTGISDLNEDMVSKDGQVDEQLQ
jgi:hypothetical protein